MDIKEFDLNAPTWKPVPTPDELPKDLQEQTKRVGVDVKEKLRSGTLFWHIL